MKNTANLKSIKPLGAEGRVCINYTDPITGKIKEQVKGTNHVFTSSLFGGAYLYPVMESIPLYMSDNTDPVDVNFPFMTGNMIGSGTPLVGGSGTYIGAWNAVSGYLGAMTSTGISSKFVYDFTPAQVTQEVKQIGLTWQFSSFVRASLYPWAQKVSYRTYGATRGAYTSIMYKGFVYEALSGIVTKTDLLTGAATTYDLTATVGTTYTSIGINPNDDTFYLKVGSSTTNKKVYKYADDSFSTLVATYPISAYIFTASVFSSFGVWGNYLYDLRAKKSINFVTDSEYSDITIAVDPGAIPGGYLPEGLFSLVDEYFIASGGSTPRTSVIFSLKKGSQVGMIKNVTNMGYTGGMFRCPFNSDDKAIYTAPYLSNREPSLLNNAIAIYRLPVDAPARPAGSGMTVTYELDIIY